MKILRDEHGNYEGVECEQYKDVDELKDYSREINSIVRELSLLEGEEW